MRAFLREILIILIIAIVIVAGLQFIAQDYVIREYCMEPNFQEGQRVYVLKLAYKLHEPERGDVIVFRPPPPHSPKASPFIKRIIALPGDTVEIKKGSVYVNGSQLDEPYIKEPPNYTFQQYKIPEDNYFVLGDNRNNANDSHNGWTVPRQNIIGKAWLSFWPPTKWGLVTHYPLQEQLISSSMSTWSNACNSLCLRVNLEGQKVIASSAIAKRFSVFLCYLGLYSGDLLNKLL